MINFLEDILDGFHELRQDYWHPVEMLRRLFGARHSCSLTIALNAEDRLVFKAVENNEVLVEEVHYSFPIVPVGHVWQLPFTRLMCFLRSKGWPAGFAIRIDDNTAKRLHIADKTKLEKLLQREYRSLLK